MRKLTFVVCVALVIVFGAAWRRIALHSGFWSDDYLHYAMLHDLYPLKRAIWDLFRFSDGSREEMQRHLDFGSFPFWSHPNFQLGMLRPLPSLTRALDEYWFGTTAELHHWHTFVWWALSVCTAAGLLLRLFAPTIAAAAVFCYALDEAHSVPIVWLSNRSVLMAATFGFSALWAHVAWRARPQAGTRILSISAFVLALACGEYSLSICGYFASLELLSTSSVREKLRALAPVLLLSIVFVLGASLAGYGSAHSGIYASPISEPRRFLEKLFVAVPVLAADLALAIPADWWTFGCPWGIQNFRTLQVIAGLLVPGLAWSLWTFARSGLSRDDAHNARWLALGGCLSLIPVSGSFVTSRLLVVGSLGAAGFVAAVALGVARRLPALGWHARLPAAVLVLTLFWLHLVRAPLMGLETTRIYSRAAHSNTAWALSLELDPAVAAHQRVIQFAAFDASDAAYLPFIRALHGKPMPRTFRILSGVPCPHRLTRVTETVIDLEALCPFVLRNPFGGALTRSAEDFLLPGSLIETQGVRVAVLETPAGEPQRTRFGFDVPLEDSSLVFVESWAHGLRQIDVPKLGESRLIESPPLPNIDLLQPTAPN